MRIFGRIVLGLLVLVVAAAGYVALTFDPVAYTPQIIAAVKQATGRDLAIKGHIGLALSLNPTIEVSDATLSNPPGFSGSDMMSIGKVAIQVSLLPLLSKHVAIDRLTLTKPNIRLETDAKGRPNWIFTPQAAPAPAPSAATPVSGGASGPMTVAIKDIRIDDGVVTYRNGKTGETVTLAMKQLAMQMASPEAPLHVTAAAELDGTAFSVVADTGSLGHLTGAIRGEWMVKLAVTVAGAKIGIDGGIANPLAGTGLDLAVTGSVPDLAALGGALKQDFSPLKSVTFSAKLSGDPKALTLRDVKLASAAGDLAGDLTVTMGLPMAVAGYLKSEKLDLDALSSTAAAKPAPASAPGPAPVSPMGPAAPAKAKWLIPDKPLPMGQLQMVNADLRIAAGVLRAGGSDYKTIEAHVLLKDGVLTLDPASADLPQGHVAMTLSVDAGKTAPPVHLTLRAPGIALAPLLASLGEPPFATGNLEVVADLLGAGESLHTIASSLDGTLLLAVPGGTIDIKRIGGSAANVLQSLSPAKSGGGASVLRCLVLRMEFAHGVGTLRPLTLGSGLLNIDGEGTVSLADETLALILRSRTTLGNTAIAVPFNVSGPFLAPQTKVNEVGVAQSNAAALSGLLGGQAGPKQADSCPAALALAHGPAPGPAPGQAPGQAAPSPAPAGAVPAPAKPPNGGQMLQKLFH